MLKKMLTTTLVSAALIMVPGLWAHGGGGGMMGGGMMGGGMMGNGIMGNGAQNYQNNQMGSNMMQGFGESPVKALIDLGLSDQQIDNLVDLHSKLIKRQLPLLRRQHELSDQISDMRESDSPDLDKLQSAMTDLGKINAQLEVGFMQTQSRARGALTPDQRAELKGEDVPLFGSNWGMGYGSVQYENRSGSYNGMMGRGTMGAGMMNQSASHRH